MAATAGRAVGLLLLIWIAFRVLGQGLTLASGGVVAFLHGVNLVFHEAGHLTFAFFGEFLHVVLALCVPRRRSVASSSASGRSR